MNAEILQARKTGQILEHGDLYSEAWKLRCRHDFGYFRQRAVQVCCGVGGTR